VASAAKLFQEKEPSLHKDATAAASAAHSQGVAVAVAVAVASEGDQMACHPSQAPALFRGPHCQPRF
jgi:hypothetical protein